MSERIDGLSVGLGLDTVEMERGLNGLRDRMRTLNSEMRNNLSNFDRSDRSVQKYETRIDSLNKKVQVQERITKATREEYQKMVQEHGEGSKEAERARRAYETSEGTLNNLKRSVGNITKEMEEFRREQERLNSGWNKAGEAIEATGHKMQAIGGGMKKAGRTLSTYVTAPLVGLGAVAIRTGMNFEDSMAKVQALSGATASDLELLESTAREMGATTRYSASEAADALGYMALAGWDTHEMTNALPGVLSLATAGQIELAAASDIVTDMMSMFGMEAHEATRASDVFASAQANSNLNVSQLSEALVKAGPTAASLGHTLEDTSAILGVFANQGLKGSAAGTALDAMFRDIQNAAEDGAVEIGNTSVAVYDAEGNFRHLGAVMADVEKATEGMNDEQRRNALASVFQQQAMRGVNMILSEGTDDLFELEEGLYDATGAADEMAKTMEDNTAGSLRELRSMMEELSLQLFEELAPGFGTVLDRVKEGVTWLSSLSDETKENVVQWGLYAAALGPVLSITGNLFLVGGKLLIPMGALLKLIAAKGGLAASVGLLGTKLSSVAGFMLGPWGIGIAALLGGGYLLYDYFKDDAIPVIGEFGDEISETTADSISEFQELHTTVTNELSNMFNTSQVITEEGKDTIVGAFKDMYTMINDEQVVKFEENTSTLRDHFMTQGGVISKEEEKILSTMERNHQQRQDSLDIYYNRVEEIMTTAANESRELTELEEIELKTIRDRMQSEAIRTLSASEEEQLIIKEKMNQQKGAIDARAAADTAARSKETKDQIIADAEEQYEKTIAAIIYERDTTGSISEEKANILIGQAERQKQQSVRQAELSHDEIIALAKNQANEHVGYVDWETGEVLSKWQVFRRGLDKVHFQMLDDAKEFFDGMHSRAQSGATNMFNSVASGINSTLTAITGGLNGISKAVNWVSDKLGISFRMEMMTAVQIPMQRNPGQGVGRQKVSGVGVERMYADGTDSHPGGLAMVGDGGMKELILYPNGHVKLSPDNDTLVDLPRGTQVVSGPETKGMMEQYGIPHYRNGIGSLLGWGKDMASKGISALSNIGGQLWDWATQGGKALLGNVMNRMGVSPPNIAAGALGEIAKGSFNKIRDAAFDRVDKLIPDMVPGSINFAGLRKTSGFGPRRSPGGIGSTNHMGVDYAGPVGSGIASQTGGKVAQAGYHNIRGNFVRIKQGMFDYMYQHNQRNLVGTGDSVTKGQNIATLGSTGASTGPHLHFEIWKNGTPINPEPFIGGFADGGLVNQDGLYNIAEGGWPEFVIPTDPGKRTNAMKLLALAAKKIQGNKKPHELPNPSSSETDDTMLKLMIEQNKLLKALLMKKSDMNISREVLTNEVEEQLAFNETGAFF